jgi:imidazolonepropionase-like amidohydrolase
MALHLHGIVLPDGAERDLFVADGRLTFKPIVGAETVLAEGWILPGLTDCHNHLAIASPAPAGASAAEQIHASGRVELEAGVLALREPGSWTREAAGLGPSDGMPRVISAGRFVAPRGGYFSGLALEVGLEQAAETAATEARRSGGAWAKIVGDYHGPDGRLRPNFPAHFLAEIAQRVHAEGARVAIHALLPQVIAAAIDAGFDSIEHGSFIDPDLLSVMARKGITWVPTLVISEGVADFLASGGLPEAEFLPLEQRLERLPALVKQAYEMGVRIICGTDAGLVPHGLIADEVEALVSAGLPASAAVGAASWDGRAFLGLTSSEEGGLADLVAFDADPRRDLAILRRPTLRILGGERLTAGVS